MDGASSRTLERTKYPQNKTVHNYAVDDIGTHCTCQARIQRLAQSAYQTQSNKQFANLLCRRACVGCELPKGLTERWATRYRRRCTREPPNGWMRQNAVSCRERPLQLTAYCLIHPFGGSLVHLLLYLVARRYPNPDSVDDSVGANPLTGCITSLL